MKRTLLTFILIASISLSSFSQFGVGASFGATFPSQSLVAAELQLNGKFKVSPSQSLVITGGLNGEVFQGPSIFNTQIGDLYSFANSPYKLQITMGYGYSLQSTDVKGLNTGTIVYAAEIQKEFGRYDYALWYLRFFQSRNQSFFTIGVKGFILRENRHSQYGCPNNIY